LIGRLPEEILGAFLFLKEIWNFNLIATDSVLKLLTEKIIDLKADEEK